MSPEPGLQTVDQRIDGLRIEIPQALRRGDRLGIAQKAVNQIVENTELEQGCTPIARRHAPDMLKTSINSVRWIYGSGNPSASHVLNAYNVEKKPRLRRRDVLYHSRYHKPSVSSIGKLQRLD